MGRDPFQGIEANIRMCSKYWPDISGGPKGVTSFFCLLSDMAFKLPWPKFDLTITMDCDYNNSTDRTDWTHNISSTQTILPECDFVCQDLPLNDLQKYNRTWTEGELSVGSVASYACKGEKLRIYLNFKPLTFFAENCRGRRSFSRFSNLPNNWPKMQKGGRETLWQMVLGK